MQVGLDEGRMMKLVIRFNDVQKLCWLSNRKLSFINSVGTFHLFSSIMAWWSYLMTVDSVVGALLDQIIHYHYYLTDGAWRPRSPLTASRFSPNKSTQIQSPSSKRNVHPFPIAIPPGIDPLLPHNHQSQQLTSPPETAPRHQAKFQIKKALPKECSHKSNQ